MNPIKFGYLTKEEVKKALLKLHVEHKMSQTEIASQKMLNRHTVIKAFKELGIKTIIHNELCKKCGFKSDEKLATEISKLYHLNNLTIEQIAQKFNTSIDSIRNCMNRNGISIKTETSGICKIIELTTEEQNIIYGLLLGGATLKNNKFTYKNKNKEVTLYLQDKLIKLKPKINQNSIIINSITFEDIYDLWYKNKTKTIPDELIMNEEICYWWYTNCGSTTNTAIKFYSKGIKNLISLVHKLPIGLNYYHRGNGGILFISKQSDRKKFLEYIGKPKHNCYNHKWVVYNNKKEII
jgi:predicted DNA-binding protein YlxM (UPF0122 family)